MSTEDSAPAEVDSGDKQAILEDIDRTREQLGETVEALTAKADVKTRATQKAAEVTGNIKEKVATPVAGQVSRAKETAAVAWDKAPEPVQRQAKRAADTVNSHRAPAIGAVAVILVGLLVVWRLRRS